MGDKRASLYLNEEQVETAAKSLGLTATQKWLNSCVHVVT